MDVILTEEAMCTAIWYRLRDNEDMKDTVDGDVRVRLVWANKKEQFPYMVHRLEDNPSDDWHIRDTTYYLDFWDYNERSTRIYTMIKHAKAALDRSWIGLFETSPAFLQTYQPMTGGYHYAVVKPYAGEPKPDIIIGRLNYNFGDFIPEDTQNIWHYATQWNLRFSRSPKELKSIIGVD